MSSLSDEPAKATFVSVSPVVPVRDLDSALARYRLLGFRVRRYDGPHRYGYADRGAVSLHLSEAPQLPSDAAAEVYLYVSDADALFAEWSQAGVAGRFTEPHDTPYGLREFGFVDTDGTALRVGSWLAGFGPNKG